MGKLRRCDARCHDAQHARCGCWCGGLFHGKAGEAARRAFAAEWGPVDGSVGLEPNSLPLMQPIWNKAIDAAKGAPRV